VLEVACPHIPVADFDDWIRRGLDRRAGICGSGSSGALLRLRIGAIDRGFAGRARIPGPAALYEVELEAT
jgi:hypothetical protein